MAAPDNPSQPLGAICWYELFTRDIAAAKAFYPKVVGWTPYECGVGMPDAEVYHGWMNGQAHIGGMVAITKDTPTVGHPQWIAYVNVADVDEAAALVPTLGGRVLVAPFDYPHVGRMAQVADPSGATIYLYKGTPNNGSIKGADGIPGFFCWTDLITSDAPAAERFYKGVVKWQTWSMPMGDSTYTVWMMPGRDMSDKSAGVGGMTPTSSAAKSAWIPYITVSSVDEATARVTANDGTVTSPPHDIPGAGRSSVCVDPTGAAFGLFGRGLSARSNPEPAQ